MICLFISISSAKIGGLISTQSIFLLLVDVSSKLVPLYPPHSMQYYLAIIAGALPSNTLKLVGALPSFANFGLKK